MYETHLQQDNMYCGLLHTNLVGSVQAEDEDLGMNPTLSNATTNESTNEVRTSTFLCTSIFIHGNNNGRISSSNL